MRGMAYTELVHGNTSRDLYAGALQAAYVGFRIEDPDYATLSDHEIWDKVQRDAKIMSLIIRRRMGCACGEYVMMPNSDEDDDKIAADIMHDLVGQMHDLHGSMFQLVEGIFRGDSWAYIAGQRGALRAAGRSEREWWFPTMLHHMDRYRFRQVRDKSQEAPGNVLGIGWQYWSLTKQDWLWLEHPEWFVRFVWDRAERGKGYGTGGAHLLAAMYFYYRAKWVLLSRGIDGAQRWAEGLLTVAIDPDRSASTDQDNVTVTNQYITTLKKHLAENILAYHKGDEINVVTGFGEGQDIIQNRVTYLDNALSSLILASVLPMGGDEGVGSLARSETESDQMSAVFDFDRKTMAETLTRTLIRLTWSLNVGRIRAIAPTARMPFYAPRKTQQIDQARRDTIFGAMDRGLPIRIEDAYEGLGLTRPGPTDDQFIKPQQPATIPGNGLPISFRAAEGTAGIGARNGHATP